MTCIQNQDEIKWKLKEKYTESTRNQFGNYRKESNKKFVISFMMNGRGTIFYSNST